MKKIAFNTWFGETGLEPLTSRRRHDWVTPLFEKSFLIFAGIPRIRRRLVQLLAEVQRLESDGRRGQVLGCARLSKSTSLPLSSTIWVWSTIKFIHCPLSLSSATVDKSQQLRIWKKIKNAKNRTRCSWVRSANATYVLYHPYFKAILCGVCWKIWHIFQISCGARIWVCLLWV